jgi:uncharacterized protein (TIGR03437 family)
VALNSAETAITNSYISDFKSKEYDSQAVWGWNGPGPFQIINNYLEASGENVGFGGSDPAIANLIPSDIEIRGNLLRKPVEWRGQWMVKNLLELKVGQRVVIEGNIMEQCWADAQAGFAVQLTVRNQSGGARWNAIRDVTLSNNVIRHSGSGVNLLGRDNEYASEQMERLRISNNLFEDISSERWGGGGIFLQLTETSSVTVDHNTVLQSGMVISAYGVGNTGFVMTNNVMAHNVYGIFGSNQSPGMASINVYLSGAVIRKNVIAGADSSKYPAENYYPALLNDVQFVDRANGNYRLAATSPFKSGGTDGKDVGCDFDALAAALANAQPSPTPTPTPNPTPTPAPTPTPTPTPTPMPAGGAATFVKTDTTTQGNWKGVYGSDGYVLINDGVKYPSYAQVTANGQTPYVWATSTSDVRAVQKASADGRLASSWYSDNGFSIDLNLTDGLTHQLALYCLDWDDKGRAERVEMFDAATGALLDSRSLSSFAGGQYVVWNVAGHIRINMVLTAGSNAVVSGLFFGPVGASTTPTPNPTPTPTPTPMPTPTPTPTPVLVSPPLVVAALGTATTLAAQTSSTEAQIAPLVTGIEQAYAAFLTEATRFGTSAAEIDKALLASLYFARAAQALGAKNSGAGVQNRLQVAAYRLGQARDLMTPGTTQNISAQTAHASMLSTTFIIGNADTRSEASLAPVLAPSSLGVILGDQSQSPLSMQTSTAAQAPGGSLPYELAGVSVMFGGQAAQLLAVSPSRITFLVPAGYTSPNAEVIVTLQEGYVSRGNAGVTRVAPALFTADGSGAGAALALNASNLMPGPFDVTTQRNLSTDKRTRLIMYGTGVSGGAVNSSAANDIRLDNGGVAANLCESVTVEARTGGGVYQLPVEFAGALGRVSGLDQLNIVLIPELRGAGTVALTLIVGGQRSNSVTIAVR